MSTLVATTLQDRASARTLPMDMTIECAVKGFAGFNGVTMAQTTTFNISSITDAGVGSWYPNYTALFQSWNMPAGCAHYASSFWAYLSLGGQAPNQTISMAANIAAPGTAADTTVVIISASGKLA